MWLHEVEFHLVYSTMAITSAVWLLIIALVVLFTGKKK